MTRADNVTTDTLGLFSYKDAETNRCYYWTIDELVVGGSTAVKDGSTITGIYSEAVWNGNQQAQYYIQSVLGEDWYTAMGFCCAAWGLSVLVFLYGTSYYCSTQVKACRCFTGCLVGICLPLLQGLGTMFVYTSEWCDVEGCSMGRTTYFSIGAAAAFFLAGINFWTMEHWPGQSVLDDLDENRGWETEKKKKKPKVDNYGRKKQDKNRSRKFSGDAWVIEVEKSAAETSRDIEDEEDIAQTSDPSPNSSYSSAGYRSERYNDEPASPMVTPPIRNKRKTGRPKKSSIHKDPSGHIVNSTSASAMARYESSEHIEQLNPTYDD